MEPAKATEPDAVTKGLQSRATLKNGILDGLNKKPSQPPGWATIRLGHARQAITTNKNINTNKVRKKENRPLTVIPSEYGAGAIPQE